MRTESEKEDGKQPFLERIKQKKKKILESVMRLSF